MRTILIALAAAAFLLAAADPTDAAAQERPDFSGSWTLAESTGGGPPGGAARGGMRRGGGMLAGIGEQATITQDGSTLTVIRTTPAGEMRTVYRLDGSESRNTIRMGNNQLELVSRASWDDDALLVVTPISFGGGSGETRMSLSLNEDGQLVVETTRRGGPGGDQQAPVRSVYNPAG